MKKRIIFFLVIGVLVTITNSVYAQSEEKDTLKYWKNSGVFSLNLAQSSFSNWAAGGQNSVSLNGLINLAANYKKGKSAWDNSFDLGYGILQREKGSRWVKTDDKINLTSKYGLQASKIWYYSALFNFRTQLAPGYNYPNTDIVISNLLAPAYMTFALGMDFKPNDNLTAFLSPVTMRSTIVNDEYLSSIGAFGVDPGKKLRNEFGGYINFQYKKDDIVKNVNFLTKIDLFSNYIKEPQNVDVNWETLFVLKVNRFISATVATNLVYDDDVMINIDNNGDGITDKTGPRTQFKEVIGVGFTYKFSSK
jgi:hypothetical protein